MSDRNKTPKTRKKVLDIPEIPPSTSSDSSSSTSSSDEDSDTYDDAMKVQSDSDNDDINKVLTAADEGKFKAAIKRLFKTSKIMFIKFTIGSFTSSYFDDVRNPSYDIFGSNTYAPFL
tara:strand:+ start:795 stop:1148 length:354 start_codon:yes stop_codon:yes gene_type:complete